MSLPHAVVLGCAGAELQADEAALFAKYPPMGCILFARNIESPSQLRCLIAALKNAAGWDLPIWIDQEGGRVQRLCPPYWQNFPNMERYGCLYEQNSEQAQEFLRIGTGLLATELRDLDIDVDCHPVLDLRFPGAHDVIGNRAFSPSVETVVELSSTVMKTLCAHAVVPVMKHFPGHGRALCDSHRDLPVVAVPFSQLLEHDLAPFIAHREAPMVMTAHILYPQWDADVPATLSRKILHDWWRTEIGYTGVIVSDDLAMRALRGMGTVAELCQASLRAGADMVLYCSGDLAENTALIREAPLISDEAWQRWQRCESIRRSRIAVSVSSVDQERYRLWADQE